MTELSVRDTIRGELDKILPDAPTRELYDHERVILKAIVARLIADGYSVQAVAVVLGMRDSTIRTWISKDPEYAARIERASAMPRARLMAILWAKVEATRPGTPGAGQAVNVLAHALMPELRERKVEASVTAAPKPGESRERILEVVNRGKVVTLPDRSLSEG